MSDLDDLDGSKPKTRRRLGLGAVASGVVAAACVPKVSATIVIDDSRPRERPTIEQAEGPKPASGPDRTPPEIIAAEFVGVTRLRLHFSEPITTPASFDPADFRISFLRLYANMTSTYAYYYDPGYLNAGAPVLHTNARTHDTQLEIDFSPEMPFDFCRGIEDAYDYEQPSTTSEMGLFVHYAAGSIPIRDAAGNPMQDVGAAWVDLGRQQPPQTRMMLSGRDALGVDRHRLVRISCGPPLPPGPR